jgi:hypothetical protein
MDGSERPEQITVAFQLRGVEVPTAQENGTSQLQDRELLDRATFRRRILFRWDKDLLREAPRRHPNRPAVGGGSFNWLQPVRRGSRKLPMAATAPSQKILILPSVCSKTNHLEIRHPDQGHTPRI